MTTFWNYWADIFPSSIDLSTYTPQIIYHALTSYSSYLYGNIRKTSDAYADVDINLDKACSYLERLTQQSINDLKELSTECTDKAESCVKQLEAWSSHTLTDVKEVSNLSIGKIDGLVEDLVEKLEVTRHQIDGYKSKTMCELDEVRLDLRREVHIATDAAIAEVEDTKEDLFTFVDQQVNNMHSELNGALDKIEEHKQNAEGLGDLVASNLERKFREKIKGRVVLIIEEEVKGMKDEIKNYLEGKCEEHVERHARKIQEYCRPLIERLEESDDKKELNKLKEEVADLKSVLKQVMASLDLEVISSSS
jgi:ribosome-associated translation inhibitor RaiA